MISLDEYKNYLVNNYNWPMDSSSLLVQKEEIYYEKNIVTNFYLGLLLILIALLGVF